MSLSNSEEFARVMVSMGEFMGQGRSYEETYQHALTITSGNSLRSLWEEILTMGKDRNWSPLDALRHQQELIGGWLISVFFAGVIAGVETIWIRGGRAFLEVWRSLRNGPPPSNELQGRAFLKLVVTGIRLGLRIEHAISGSQEILDNPKLADFVTGIGHGLAGACKKYPEFFSNSLIELIEQDERSPTEMPYERVAEKLTL
jgi:hypothetical protein